MLAERSITTEVISFETKGYQLAHVSPLDINTLTQPREVFEGIPELAQSIARIGLLSELHVGIFDEIHVAKYLDHINERWNTGHTTSELKPVIINGQRTFLVLIAGERRLRACKMLFTEGCPEHQEKEGLRPCYNLHHPNLDNKIPVKLYVNPDYDTQAVEIQESENIHHSIPVGRLAISIANLWYARRANNPVYSIKDHARSVGRNEDTVRDAIHYAAVPQSIQDLVNSDYIKYGIGCQLARLYAEGEDATELARLAYKAHKDRMSIPAFTQLVSNLLKQKKIHERMDLMEVFRNNASRASRAAAQRLILSRDTRDALYGTRQTLGIALSLFESGAIGEGNSPFAEHSVVESLVAVAEEGMHVTATFGAKMGKGNVEKLETTFPKIIDNAKKELDVLEDQERNALESA